MSDHSGHGKSSESKPRKLIPIPPEEIVDEYGRRSVMHEDASTYVQNKWSDLKGGWLKDRRLEKGKRQIARGQKINELPSVSPDQDRTIREIERQLEEMEHAASVKGTATISRIDKQEERIHADARAGVLSSEEAAHAQRVAGGIRQKATSSIQGVKKALAQFHKKIGRGDRLIEQGLQNIQKATATPDSVKRQADKAKQEKAAQASAELERLTKEKEAAAAAAEKRLAYERRIMTSIYESKSYFFDSLRQICADLTAAVNNHPSLSPDKKRALRFALLEYEKKADKALHHITHEVRYALENNHLTDTPHAAPDLSLGANRRKGDKPIKQKTIKLKNGEKQVVAYTDVEHYFSDIEDTYLRFQKSIVQKLLREQAIAGDEAKKITSDAKKQVEKHAIMVKSPDHVTPDESRIRMKLDKIEEKRVKRAAQEAKTLPIDEQYKRDLERQQKNLEKSIEKEVASYKNEIKNNTPLHLPKKKYQQEALKKIYSEYKEAVDRAALENLIQTTYDLYLNRDGADTRAYWTKTEIKLNIGPDTPEMELLKANDIAPTDVYNLSPEELKQLAMFIEFIYKTKEDASKKESVPKPEDIREAIESQLPEGYSYAEFLLDYLVPAKKAKITAIAQRAKYYATLPAEYDKGNAKSAFANRKVIDDMTIKLARSIQAKAQKRHSALGTDSKKSFKPALEEAKAIYSEVLRYAAVQYGNIPIPRAEHRPGQKADQYNAEKKQIEQKTITSIDALNNAILSKFTAKIDKNSKERKLRKLKIKTIEDVDKLPDSILDHIAEHCYFDVSPVGNTPAARLRQRLIERRFLRDIEIQRRVEKFIETMQSKVQNNKDHVKKLPLYLQEKYNDLQNNANTAIKDLELLFQEKETTISADAVRNRFSRLFETTKTLFEFGITQGIFTARQPLETILAEARKHLEERALKTVTSIPLDEIVNPDITKNTIKERGLRGLAPTESERRQPVEHVDLLELLGHTDISPGNVIHDILTGTISTSRYDSLTNRDYNPPNPREKDGSHRKDFYTAKLHELRNAKRLMQYPIPSNEGIKERYTDLYSELRSKLDTLAHDRGILEADLTAPGAKEEIARNHEAAAAIEHTLVEFEKFVRNQIYAGFILGNAEPYNAWKKIPELADWTSDITPPTSAVLRENFAENAVQAAVDDMRDMLRDTLARRGLYRQSWKKDALVIGNYLNALEKERGKRLTTAEKKQLMSKLNSADIASLDRRQLEIAIGSEKYKALSKAIQQEEALRGRPLKLKEIRDVIEPFLTGVSADDIAKIISEPLVFPTAPGQSEAIIQLRHELEAGLDERSRLSPIFARIDTILSDAIPLDFLKSKDGKLNFTEQQIQASISAVVENLRDLQTDNSIPDDVQNTIAAFIQKIELSNLPVEQVLKMVREYRDSLRHSRQNEISPDQARGIELILTRERLSGDGSILLRDLVNRNTITEADLSVLNEHILFLKKDTEAPSAALSIIADYAKDKPLILDMLGGAVEQNMLTEQIERLVGQRPPDIDALASTIQKAIEHLPSSKQLPFAEMAAAIRSYASLGTPADDATKAKFLSDSKKFLDAYKNQLLSDTIETIEGIVHRVQAEKVGWEEMRAIFHDDYIGSLLANIVESANTKYPRSEAKIYEPNKARTGFILDKIKSLLLSRAFITPTMRGQIDAIIRSPATLEQNLAAIVADADMAKRLERLLALGKQGGELEKTMLDLLKEGVINSYIADLYRADTDDVPWPTDYKKNEDDPWYLDMTVKLAEERPLIDRLRQNRHRIIEFYSSIKGCGWPSEKIADLNLTHVEHDRINSAGDLINIYFALADRESEDDGSAKRLVNDFELFTGKSLMNEVATYLKSGESKKLQDIEHLLHIARETMDARTYISQLTGIKISSINRDALISCQELLFSYFGKDIKGREAKLLLHECEFLCGNTVVEDPNELMPKITDYIDNDNKEPLVKLLEQARQIAPQRLYIENTILGRPLFSVHGDFVVKCAKHFAAGLPKNTTPAKIKKIIDTANQFLGKGMLVDELVEMYCSTGDSTLLKKMDTALLRSQYMIEADTDTKAKIDAAAMSIKTMIKNWMIDYGGDIPKKILSADLMRVITANTVSYAGYADGVMRPGDLDPSKLTSKSLKELQKQVRQINANLLRDDEQIPANFITNNVDDIAHLDDKDLDRINQTIDVFLSPLGNDAENLLQQRLIAQKIITHIRELDDLDPNSSVTSEHAAPVTDTEAPGIVPPKNEMNDIDPAIRHALSEDEKRIYEFHIRETNPVYFDSMPPLFIPREVSAIRTLYARLDQWKNDEASTPEDKHRADMAISALRLNIRQGVELISDPGQRRDVSEALKANELFDWISDLPKPTAETYRQAAIANEVTAFREELKEKMNRPEPMIFIPTPDTKIRQEAYKRLRAELEKEKDDTSNPARDEALKMLTTFRAEVKESFGQRMRYLTETRMESQVLDKENMMNNILYFWREAGLADWLETTRVIAPDYQPKPLTPRPEAKKAPPPTPEPSSELPIEEASGGVVEKTPSAVARVEKTSNQRVKRIVAEPTAPPVSSAASASAEAVSPAAAPEAPATPAPAPETPSSPPTKTPASPKKPAGWFRRNLSKILFAAGMSTISSDASRISDTASQDRPAPQMERTADPPRTRLPDAGTSTVTATRDAGVITPDGGTTPRADSSVTTPPDAGVIKIPEITVEPTNSLASTIQSENQTALETALKQNRIGINTLYRKTREADLRAAYAETSALATIDGGQRVKMREITASNLAERTTNRKKYFDKFLRARGNPQVMIQAVETIAAAAGIPTDILIGKVAYELMPGGELRDFTAEAFRPGGPGMEKVKDLASYIKISAEYLPMDIAIVVENLIGIPDRRRFLEDMKITLTELGANKENIANIIRLIQERNPEVKKLLKQYGVSTTTMYEVLARKKQFTHENLVYPQQIELAAKALEEQAGTIE